MKRPRIMSHFRVATSKIIGFKKKRMVAHQIYKQNSVVQTIAVQA